VHVWRFVVLCRVWARIWARPCMIKYPLLDKVRAREALLAACGPGANSSHSIAVRFRQMCRGTARGYCLLAITWFASKEKLDGKFSDAMPGIVLTTRRWRVHTMRDLE
jgi:hypothetical protein